MVRRLRAALPWFLALVTVLAGCSDGGKPAKSDTFLLGDGSQVELAEGASLVGVVVDEAIRPIGGANVTVLGLNLTAATTPDGLFAFEELEPGFYNLEVVAGGFLAIQSQAEVRAGETSRVRIQMTRDLNPQPYHNTLHFEWYDSAGITLVDFTVDLVSRSFLGSALPPACDICYFHFDTDMPPTQFIFEAVWDDSVAFPLRDTSYFWTLDAHDSGDYEAEYCTSPCYVLVPMGEFGNDTRYGLGLSGDELWVTFSQKVDIYLTTWYLGPPPEGWSIVAETGKP